MDYLPGTTVEVKNNNSARGFLDSAFALNGLVLSQIVQLTGLEPHTIQNWVKRKFIEPPQQKKYDCNQFCRIAIINMLKDIFHIERIVHMLDYVQVNGDVDDMQGYLVFCDVMSIIPPDAIVEPTDVDGIVGTEVDKLDVKDGSRARLRVVVKVMVLSYISARIRKRADLLLMNIEN